MREFDLFEFACADNSSIDSIGPSLGVDVCRPALNTCNFTSKPGFRTALALVRNNAGASMHSSIPCTYLEPYEFS